MRVRRLRVGVGWQGRSGCRRRTAGRGASGRSRVRFRPFCNLVLVELWVAGEACEVEPLGQGTREHGWS